MLTTKAATQSSDTQSAALVLLLLSVVSPLVGDLLLFRLADFPVTPGILFLALTSLLIVLSRGQKAPGSLPMLIAVFMLIWELLRGPLFGVLTNVNWIRSVALFVYLVVSFIVCSRLQVVSPDLTKSARVLAFIGMAFGLLGVVQFVLQNVMSLALLLPPRWSVSAWEPGLNTYRTGGIQQVAGLSTEPAAYATALAVVLVLLMYFIRSGYLEDDPLLGWLASVFTVAGMLVSLSLSGWLLALAVISVSLVTSVKNRIWFLSAAGLILVVALVMYSFRPSGVIVERLERVLEGQDRSAQARVDFALGLLAAPSGDPAVDVFGRGVGVEEAYQPLVDQIYGFEYGRSHIHNIFTVVRVMQGWLGLILYVLLLSAVTRPSKTLRLSAFYPLLTLLILYHFANGRYLDVTLWALLALITVLTRVDLSTIQSRRTPSVPLP